MWYDNAPTLIKSFIFADKQQYTAVNAPSMVVPPGLQDGVADQQHQYGYESQYGYVGSQRSLFDGSVISSMVDV